MHIFIIILFVIAGIIALLLLIALFTKKGYAIDREIIINAPRQKVFDYLKYLKNHENFKKWSAADLDRKTEYKGTDGTAGFIFAWNGNKNVGEGEHEIKSIVDGKSIETEIRFVRPFVLTGYTTFRTESVSDNQTKVNFSNSSTLKYPLNILLLMVEKNIAKDMDTSLAKLKSLLEE